MPSKRGSTRQALTGKPLKEFRHDVAKLKAKGLVSKYKDARKQKPTRYMRSQVEKYRDVLEGKATVQHIPRNKAKQFSDKFRVKGRAVVIPKEKGETVSYSKKSNEFYGVRRIGNKRIRKSYSSGKFEDVIKLPRNEGKFYRIEFAGGQVWTFDAVEDLVAFMHPYEAKPKNPFKDWGKYVEILDIDDA